MRLIPLALIFLAFAGCQTRTEKVQMLELRNENKRLSDELARLSTDNMNLRDANESLSGEIARLRSTRPDPTAAAPRPVRSAPVTPAKVLTPVREVATPAGSWVVVLASVGPGSVQGQQKIYADNVSSLNKRYGAAHGSAFGTRTPRSGGLQLIYGSNAGAIGVTKAKAQSVLNALNGTYRDAYLLNID